METWRGLSAILRYGLPNRVDQILEAGDGRVAVTECHNEGGEPAELRSKKRIAPGPGDSPPSTTG